MIKRVIEISNQSYCYKKNAQLLVEQDGKQVAKIPIEDIGVLIFDNHSIVISAGLTVACQKNNIAVVFCDERHLPYSLLLPLVDANSLHSKVLLIQVAAKKPLKKQLWKKIVETKIHYQLNHLNKRGIENRRLERVANTVQSGDPKNNEAQAAKLYWRLLFGEQFRRDVDASGINSMLNYGYAIIRAMIARAIVSSGLHPAFGFHHHNQYNGLNLADDLMEPFRSWIDEKVFDLVDRGVDEINKESKEELLKLVGAQVRWKDNSMPFMVCSHEYINQFKKALSGDKFKLEFPSLK